MTVEIAKKVLTTFFVSMVPVIELRGAIPIGVGLGLGHFEAMIISILGNILPVPFIVLFIRNIFAWIRRNLPKLDSMVTKIEEKAHMKSEQVIKWQALGLCIFVAIPLPGTGAWTGALIAALLDIRLRKALPSIALGVVIAGLLITGLTYGFTAIFI